MKKPLVSRQFHLEVLDIQRIIMNNYFALALMAVKRSKMYAYGTGRDGAVWGTPAQYHKPAFDGHFIWGDPWAAGNQRNEPWHLSNPKQKDSD
jgi:hypothetical protein